MTDPTNLSRDDWEALLHAPFAAYSVVVEAEAEITSAQFRRLREELATAERRFADGTTGRTLVEAVNANLDVLWDAYLAAGHSPGDVVRRAVKALGHVAPEESEAIRDWLAMLAVRVAEADRVVGEGPMSWDELGAMRELAGWLKRPLPELRRG